MTGRDRPRPEPGGHRRWASPPRDRLPRLPGDRRRRLPAGEAGAYAVLYALTLTIFIGFAAIVVDLSLLRLDRRVDRLAADAAAVAAASYLRPADARDPERACRRAWAYLAGNIADLDASGATGHCAGFAAYKGAACPPAQIDQSASVGDFQVTVSWPVPVGSPLLLPDLSPGTALPPVDLSGDGAPCDRVGVTVTRTRSFLFAPALSTDRASTRVHSVALAEPPAGDDEVAALVTLDTDGLAALCARQGGSITADSYDDGGTRRPGIIAVDSDGTVDAKGCDTGDDYVIVTDPDAGTTICADGSAGSGCDGTGYIDAYAKGPYGDSARAHDPAASLSPLPTGVTQRIGPDPLFSRYGCATAGPVPPGECHTPNNVQIQRDRIADPATEFTRLTDTEVPGFACDATTAIFIPNGRWLVDCPEFRVSANVVFGGAYDSPDPAAATRTEIVFTGDVRVIGSGCLAVNVPLRDPTTGDPLPPGSPVDCPSVTGDGGPGDTTDPAPTADGRVFLRGGDLRKDPGATLLLPQTFGYQQAGSIDLAGGDGGRLLWTAARADGCSAGDDLCRSRRFDKLLLWSDSSDPVRVDVQDSAGGPRLTLAGVVFAPQAALRLTGSGPVTVPLQLFAATVDVAGVDVVLAPDPADSIPVPNARAGIRLIR
jgi:hypothetical protein